MLELGRLLDYRVGIAAAGLAFVALIWQWFDADGLPEGFARANGRIEAVEIDISTRTSGRIKEILIREGQFVKSGDVLARMDAATLEAQLREAQAQLKRSVIGVKTAKLEVARRQSEKLATEAVVAQRNAELSAAAKRLGRSQQLAPKGAVSVQVLDDRIAAHAQAKAALRAAEAQVAATEAAVAFALAQVVSAEAAVDAAKATVERLKTDIEDAILKAPRDGRIQYRIAEPGEVVGPGGKVVNMVDVGDVYMTFFLPTKEAGSVAIGAETHLILDAAPQYVIPAKVSLVADVAQFTPKTVETAEERQKLMFRIKARIDPTLLRKHLEQVKTGLPGTAYVRLDPRAEWPAHLRIKVPK